MGDVIDEIYKPVEVRETKYEGVRATETLITRGGMGSIYRVHLEGTEPESDVVIKEISKRTTAGALITYIDDFVDHVKEVSMRLRILGNSEDVDYCLPRKGIEVNGRRCLPEEERGVGKIVFPMIEGEDGEDYLKAHPEQFLDIFSKLARETTRRHKAGIYGSDAINNFMITPHGRIVIIDPDLSHLARNGVIKSPPISANLSKPQFVHPDKLFNKIAESKEIVDGVEMTKKVVLDNEGRVKREIKGGTSTVKELEQLESYSMVSWCFQSITNGVFPYVVPDSEAFVEKYGEAIAGKSLRFVDGGIEGINDGRLALELNVLSAKNGKMVSLEEFQILARNSPIEHVSKLPDEDIMILYYLFSDNLAKKDKGQPIINLDKFLSTFQKLVTAVGSQTAA